MGLYKLSADGAFEPFEEKPFGDLEQKLEQWVEANPHLVSAGDRFVVFGRQVRTVFGRIIDLLAIDETGAVVVIELKRGETPRQVIAQALEYAAWVDSLTLDELNEIAQSYTTRHGGEAKDLVALHEEAFSANVPAAEDTDDPDSSDLVTFNHAQRIVIVAENFSGEVEQTLRYLRSKMGVDVVGVSFGIHESAGDLLIQTETLVGREQPVSVIRKGRSPAATFSDDEIRDKATQPFVKEAVGRIEDWVDQLDLPNVELKVGRKTARAIYLNGKRTSRFYYAKEWIYVWINNYTPAEVADLQSRLSSPGQVITDQPREGFVRFHLTTAQDLELYKDLLQHRFSRQ